MNLRIQLLAPRLIPALLALALVPACRAQGENPQAPSSRLDLRLDLSPLEAGEQPRVTSYADVIAPVQPAVVSVHSSRTVRQRLHVPEFFRQFYGDRFPSEQEQRQRGLGSGVIVSRNGYILTNNHVVAEADELKVTLSDGREFEARLVGTDPKTDVAVIKIDSDNLPVATLADSDKLRVGDLVFAIGNPLGIGQTVTMGIISATGRRVGILDNRRTAGYEDFIQTDAAINQGNSGGALIDAQGRLVGINTAILSGGGGNIGIGFAIPINMASSILTSLVETGSVQRGLLGVGGEDLRPDIAEALGLRRDQRGVIVTNLTREGPAEQAGLRRSDVIISLDGRAITTFFELRNLVAARAPGSVVELRILRDGQESTIRVTLGSLDTAVANTELLPGVTARPLDEEARRRIGAPRDLSGLIITEVAENSPFANRLSPGMVVVEINREAVTELEEARRLLRPGRNLLIVFVRGMFSPIAITVR